MLGIDNQVKAIKKCLSSLKKSRYKIISTKTLSEKAEFAKRLKNEIEEYLLVNESEISESKIVSLSKAARETNFEIQQIIKQKLKENKLREKKIIMANPPPPGQAVAGFDIKTATSLVQNYDGSASGLDAFIDSVNLLNDLITADHLVTAIKFIKTRLSGKARAALPPNPQTIIQITDAIKSVCKSIETPEAILAKLKATRNKGDQQKFAEEVENLTQKLSTLYVENQIPLGVANKMATSAGVETLINGVHNTELKTILRANDFSSIQKAIQKINESQPLHTTQVLNYRVQNFNRGRGRGNNGNNFRGSNSRNGYRNQNQYQYQNQSQNNYRGRGNNYRRGNGRGNHHQNYGQNNQNYNRGGQGHTVYYAQTGNCPVPQQMIVGGDNPLNQQRQTQQQQNQQIHQCAMINRS